MLYNRRNDLSQVGRDLLAAADYIREHGWCQGVAVDYEGRVCIEGALAKTIRSETIRYDPGRLVNARMGLYGTGMIPSTYSPSEWNDKRGRKVDEVLDLLENAAWSEVEK